MSKRLVRIIDHERVDNKNTIEALRLQAKAWRQLCLIALVDQKRGAAMAQMLFFQTVPFVNGEFVGNFVKETAEAAKQAGIDAGVFSNPAQPPQRDTK